MRDEDYRRIVDELRGAGTEVELDADRVRGRFAARTGADRVGSGTGSGRGGRGMFRHGPLAGGGFRLPVLSLSMVGAAIVVLVVFVLVARPGPASVQVVDNGVAGGPAGSPTPAVTTSGAESSHTSVSESPSLSSGDITGSIMVTPVEAGSRVDLGSVDGMWLVAGFPENQQVTGSGTVQGLGPAQVMGSGDKVAPGPYRVAWPEGSVPAGASDTWLTVPRQVRGVSAGLRIPLRLREVPATVTVFTGTIGGAGQLRIAVQEAGGSIPQSAVELPECGQDVCPAVVSIELSPDVRMSGSLDVFIEIEATGSNASVGIAAVQLG